MERLRSGSFNNIYKRSAVELGIPEKFLGTFNRISIDAQCKIIMSYRPNQKQRRKDVITWSKVMTKDEQERLFAYLQENATTVSGKKLLLMCDILLHTGLRELEICSMRVQDTPMILGTDNIVVYRGKGNKDRMIPVSERLTEAIAEYVRDIRPKTLPRYVARQDITRQVFYSQLKKPFTKDWQVVNKKTGEMGEVTRVNGFYYAVRRGGIKAKIAKRITPHIFRHTFAVNSLLNGVDIYTLSYLMGHSSIEVTAKYLHLLKDVLKGLGDKLDTRAKVYAEMPSN